MLFPPCVSRRTWRVRRARPARRSLRTELTLASGRPYACAVRYRSPESPHALASMISRGETLLYCMPPKSPQARSLLTEPAPSSISCRSSRCAGLLAARLLCDLVVAVGSAGGEGAPVACLVDWAGGVEAGDAEPVNSDETGGVTSLVCGFLAVGLVDPASTVSQRAAPGLCSSFEGVNRKGFPCPTFIRPGRPAPACRMAVDRRFSRSARRAALSLPRRRASSCAARPTARAMGFWPLARSRLARPSWSASWSGR